MFVESDNEDTEYTSNHVIIAGEDYIHIYVSIFKYLEGGDCHRLILLYLFEISSYSYLYLPVPLGVLKRSHREMFVPSLSKGKKYSSCIFLSHRNLQKRLRQ